MTPKLWSDCVDHVQRIFDNYWINDGMIDDFFENIEPIIINTAESCSSTETEDTEESDSEFCRPLV